MIKPLGIRLQIVAGVVAALTLSAASATPPPESAEASGITNLRTLSRQWRVDLLWDGPSDQRVSYQVQRSSKPDSGFEDLPKRRAYPICTDFIGAGATTYYYRVRAIPAKAGSTPYAWSAVVAGTSAKRDESKLLDELQEAHVRFMTIASHPESGMARDWLDPYKHHYVNNGTCIGTGLGIANYIVAVERKFMSRKAARTRVLRLLRFLDAKAERHHGAFGHWTNHSSGKIIPFGPHDDGGDIAETAYLIQGLIIAREYFIQNDPEEKEIRVLADRIWRGVDWNWFRKDGGNALYWHWSPNHHWKMNLPIVGFNENEIAYILALASPTHSVPTDSYFKGWRNPWYGKKRTHHGVEVGLGTGLGGCSFWTYYSYVGLDPRRIHYGGKSNFEHFQDLTKLQIAYVRSKADQYKGYGDLWGFTAAPGPDGYSGHKPGADNGTLSPVVAPSVMPYVPQESLACMQKLYYDHGKEVWQEFGFVIAFNPSRNWVYRTHLTPDTAPVAPMIENYRSGLLWKLFMNAPEIKKAMAKLEAAQAGTTSRPINK